jgi:tetratricopeptide (TPR) repeat protein/predicted Ser/Thr protein kinase
MVPHQSTHTDRERRLDEAIAEYLEAVDAGRRPPHDEWLARFPDLAPDLARFFGDQDQVHNLLGSIVTTGAVDNTPRHDNRDGTPAVSLRYFGDYELMEEVARGGMGVVYRARQTSLNRIVALKMILAGQLAASADVQRFRSEAEATANLEHPHIVPIYEIGEHEGHHYFTMKFIEGGNLAQHMARFRGHPKTTAHMLAMVARAVHHAHQRGILHRDLKPANILLDEQLQPHLTDFGLARRLQGGPNLTRTGTALGTPGYMAPEQAYGPSRAVTTAADVYSLGAILYELLCGRPPFRAEHPLETLRHSLEREPERPRAVDPRVSRDLETICLKCLEKEPGRRYQSAAELADDLERVLRGEPVRARRVSLAERLWRWCRRHPLTAALTAALVLSLGAAASLITWQWRLVQANFQQAEEQRASAEKERARAEEGFRQAHKAVNDFCTRVSEGQMRDVPGLQPVRRELLEAALAYYERFLRERGQDPALQAELADIHFRIATITSLLGPKPEALKAYARARSMYEDLLRVDPGSAALRTALAETHARTGILQAETGQPEAALASYLEASRLYAQLLGEQPGNPALQSGAATVFNHLGMLHRWAGRTSEALLCQGRARELQESLVHQYPSTADYRANLAVTYYYLAGLKASLGNRTDARALYRLARELQERLVLEHPVNFRFQQELAATCRQLGGELLLEQDFAEALQTLERGQLLLERLVALEPGMASLKSDLAAHYRQTGHAYRNNGELEQGLAFYDKALAVNQELVRLHPEVTDFRNELAKSHFDRAGVLGKMGQHDKSLESNQAAADLRRDLVKANPGHLGYRCDLGLTLGNLGVALWNLGRREEALAVVRESTKHYRVAFTGAPEVARYRGFLTGSYIQTTQYTTEMGLTDEVIAAALERKKLWPAHAGELYNTAADVARAAQLRSVHRRSGGNRLADVALAVLREAVAAGFRDGPRLQNDPAFAALHGRSDFEEILAALLAKK